MCDFAREFQIVETHFNWDVQSEYESLRCDDSSEDEEWETQEFQEIPFPIRFFMIGISYIVYSMFVGRKSNPRC